MGDARDSRGWGRVVDTESNHSRTGASDATRCGDRRDGPAHSADSDHLFRRVPGLLSGDRRTAPGRASTGRCPRSWPSGSSASCATKGAPSAPADQPPADVVHLGATRSARWPGRSSSRVGTGGWRGWGKEVGARPCGGDGAGPATATARGAGHGDSGAANILPPSAGSRSGSVAIR